MPSPISSALVCLSLILPICTPAAFAAPFLPSSDLQVLERLPFKPNDPVARELADLRRELQKTPNDVALAVKLARRYYNLVAQEGDPRYLGYAQAALAPWWQMPAPPTEVQMLRAGLAQFRHDFAGALADLDQILLREPQHANARVLRAVIHIVQARYEMARADCRALQGRNLGLIATGCMAMVDGLTGHANQAYQSLQSAFAAAKGVAPDEQLWVLTRLAEISLRLGKNELAEAHFKQALGLGMDDTFLLAAYADFLLEQDRNQQVLALLQNKTRSDVLLLRLVFAERRLNLPTAKEREATLAARYHAAQLRADTVHQQEEARFALHVQNEAARALALALENWKVQREPRDARIVLESALAQKNPSAAREVLQWLDSSRIEEQGLLLLAKRLKEVRP